MELEQLTEQVYILGNKVNIGVIVDVDGVILIDSGLDGATAKQALQLLRARSLEPKALINTHSHADHYGGTAYLQTETELEVYAPALESAVIEYPQLEPLYLFSGAAPISELENKFLLGAPAQVDRIIEEDKLSFTEVELQIIELPGHSFNQLGVVFDNIIFCADSFFSKAVLAKHKIPFHVNITQAKETLQFLLASEYSYYVSGHGKVRENPQDLIAENLALINQIEEQILTMLEVAKSTEEVLKELTSSYGIEIETAQQYYLLKTGVTAFLSHLKKDGALSLELKDNCLYWLTSCL
ncbi:MBL fold metallo-hydrolase [Fuchsiella alkaliacetigena]|uniref:MBL fold metallo-hydrolase n=1 Tax=Fuchsiella alkaliacetigena TaxID=957042 RepID=UPI00200AD214|nr:MBL fold metallo-hydrolase [Fuchsiella alkaliacetigena]MCK8825806.1 MBL fold metallo-hydrolase [Fuchsiella alkaliacetigena]